MGRYPIFGQRRGAFRERVRRRIEQVDRLGSATQGGAAVESEQVPPAITTLPVKSVTAEKIKRAVLILPFAATADAVGWV